MPRFLQRLLRGAPPPPAPHTYRTVQLPPLTPGQVRDRTFGAARRRGGFDASEVRAFLRRTAGDLAAAYAELDSVREENDRIKRALRQWQSAQWHSGQWPGTQPQRAHARPSAARV